MSSEKDMKRTPLAVLGEGTAKDGSNNKQYGVRRAEAFAKLIRGKGGKKIFWIIAIAIYVCNWVVSKSALAFCTFL